MTYEYACAACGHEWEAEQSIRDQPLKKCPKCSKLQAKRQISRGAGFILKGGGWYADGYGSSGSGAGGAKGSSSSGEASATPSSDKPAADKPAADKPAADKPSTDKAPTDKAGGSGASKSKTAAA